MMRIIKFRAKLNFTGTIGSDEWVYSETIRFGSNNTLYINGQSANIKTLGEFTGLYDRTKKEIFEGDIVKVSAGWSGDFYFYEARAKVIYDMPEFCLDDLDTDYCIQQDFDWNELEVVGNIHEPKLEE